MSFGKIALVVVSTLIGLAIAETALRLFGRDLAGEPITSNQYLFYRYDPVLGWSNRPGATGVFKRREFSYDVKINRFGLRGRETTREKPAHVKRIAVLGDSFTWGIGANDNQLYTAQLEQALPGTEVLNFGISGYGPVQYHLLTEKVLSFAPDVVVIGFCLGNDFIDNVLWQRYRYYKPYATLDERGGLGIEGYPIPNVKRFPSRYDGGVLQTLHQNSYVFRLLDRHTLGLIGRLENFGQKGLSLSGRQREFYATPDDPEVQKAVAINAALMKAMADAYGARGIRVVVLAIPTGCEFGVCFPELKSDPMVTLKLLRQSLKGLSNVTLVDPTKQLSLAIDYWKYDGHWRPIGHRKVAQRLLPAIRAALAPD